MSKTSPIATNLSTEAQRQIIATLETRFKKNMNRHKGVDWATIQARLESSTEKLWALHEMERTGGEPDVVGYEPETGKALFFDCSSESPRDRRSLCYDHEALNARKENKPTDSAVNMAEAMGIVLLTEEQLRELQTLGDFDLKTSSWLKTPDSVRKLGGAIFADRRYDRVFVFHNGADSYYASRGFRGSLRV